MSVISSLSILLKADSSMFINSMKRTVEAMKSFGRWAMRVTKWIAGIAVALTGLSAFSLTRIFNEAMKEADRIGKLSDELGTSVDSLFSLKHAAEITGTSFSVMTRGLQRMNRRIGEANLGYGEAVKSLTRLGLAAKDMAQLSSFEQFSLIAESIGKVGTQADKAGVLYGFFGRQGQDLINTLALGRGGLKKMADEVEHLLGKFTRDEFRVFEEMNDSVVRLNLAAKGLMLRLGKEFSQIIGAGLKELTELLVRLRENHLPAMAAAVRGMIATTITWLQKAMPYIVLLGEGFVSLTIFAWDAMKGLAGLVSKYIQVIGSAIRPIAAISLAFLEWGTGLNIVKKESTTVINFWRAFFVTIRKLPELFSVAMGIWTSMLTRLVSYSITLYKKMMAKIVLATVEGAQLIAKALEAALGKFKFIEKLANWVDEGAGNIADKIKAQIEGFGKGDLSLQEIFDTSGFNDEFQDIVDEFNRDPDKKGGLTDSINQMLERIKNFKLGIPPIAPSGQLMDVARTLKAFSKAAEFGSQQAVEIMSTFREENRAATQREQEEKTRTAVAAYKGDELLFTQKESEDLGLLGAIYALTDIVANKDPVKVNEVGIL